jgi:flagellar hook-associated protein 2
MASSSAIYNANSPYETLISSMITIERQPQLRLKDERNEQNRMNGVLSDLHSKLSALHTLLKRFSDPLSNPFGSRGVATSATAFSATAAETAMFGAHTLKVERLASADTRISQQFTSSGNSLRAFFDSNGAQTFTIQVASPTIDDTSRRVDVTVTIDPTGSTDAEILKEISAAINAAMNDAAADGTIKKAEVAGASVVNETADTARLSLRSGQTGFANRLEFGDSAAGLLALLGVTNDAVATGTGGGQVVAVGTSETDSELNSKFVLDGLTLYRSKNEVSDAIDGVTIQLKQVMTEPASFTVEPNAEASKKEINDFIKSYNEILAFIKGKSSIDADAGVRGDFANESAYTELRFGMRMDVVGRVSSQPAEAPTYITDLGIEIASDGSLSIKDAEKLTAALQKDPDAVRSLFAGSDGIAKRLETRIEKYVGINGFIKSRQKVIDERIRRYDKRIADMDDQLARRETQLRMQFAKLQETIALLQGQQQMLFGYVMGY